MYQLVKIIVLALPFILSSDMTFINFNREMYGFGLISKKFFSVSLKTLLCFPINKSQ